MSKSNEDEQKARDEIARAEMERIAEVQRQYYAQLEREGQEQHLRNQQLAETQKKLFG